MIRSVLIAFLAFPICALGTMIGDAAKGQIIAGRVCAACHGNDGVSPSPVNPNLAGQHPEYLLKQLRNFKSGERSNPIMMAMMATLSDEDMRNLAAYYASQKPALLSARDEALATQGRKLFRGGINEKGVAACAGCHSPNGAGIPAQFPRISGQHAEYTAAQLKAFRAEERGNDENMMMRTIASISSRDLKRGPVPT